MDFFYSILIKETQLHPSSPLQVKLHVFLFIIWKCSNWSDIYSSRKIPCSRLDSSECSGIFQYLFQISLFLPSGCNAYFSFSESQRIPSTNWYCFIKSIHLLFQLYYSFHYRQHYHFLCFQKSNKLSKNPLCSSK